MATSHATGCPKSPQSGLISVGKAAAICSVSGQTIRNWISTGQLEAYRLNSGHRRIETAKVLALVNGKPAEASTRKIIIYARVSDSQQSKANGKGQSDLIRQAKSLRDFASEHYKGEELIEFVETGSSFNFERKKLNRMLDMILSGELDGSTLLITHKDRIFRWGYPIIEKVARHHGISIVITEKSEGEDLEKLRAEDLISIIHLFSMSLYGSRSALKKRKPPTQECMDRANELLRAGLGKKPLTKQLRSEGHDITEWRVYQYVVKPAEKLQRALPSATLNSCQEYYREFAMNGDPSYRVGFKRLYQHYENWCKDNDRVALHMRRLSAEFNSHYNQSYSETEGNCYKGLQIKGASLHVIARNHVRKPKQKTQIDGVIEFYESQRGKTLFPYQIVDNYRAYISRRGLGEPLERDTVLGTIKQLGGVTIKKNRALAIQF